MKIKITKNELSEQYELPSVSFPKYTSQLINWANQNAQGTRPKVVGQMSELFPEYRRSFGLHSVKGWETWYKEKYPEAIKNATDKICGQMENLKQAIKLIDRSMIEAWVEDLVINKTYQGLYYQQVILTRLAADSNMEWRLSSPEEEAKGIDGFIGDKPYSIKPGSYKTMDRLQESIDVTIIYYSVNSAGDLIVEVQQ